MKSTVDSTAEIRAGYDIIIEEVPTHSRVLDLGCGDGVLLHTLQRVKKVDGYGVELSAEGVSVCLEKGLYCYQGDIDDGLADYKSNSFDYVILNQTLQSTKKPEYVLAEIMRIGKNAVISFPNFGYYRIRMQLLIKGTMPKNRLLPYEWYESPNIHLLTIRDFRRYCRERGYPVKNERHFNVGTGGVSIPSVAASNLFAQYGMFILDGAKFSGAS